MTAPAFGGADLAAQAQCLRLDVAALEAISALRDAGIRSLLLRGPVIARWLYADAPHERTYVDVDLLVAVGDLARAGEVLTGIGYVAAGGLRFRPERLAPKHAEAWFRGADGISLDLHRSIHGLERVAPITMWRAATRDTATFDLCGDHVEVPGEAFRALHIVQHAASRLSSPGPRRDLERAVARLDDNVWRRAGELADELGVVEQLGPVVRTVAGGDALADALGWGSRWPATLAAATSDERSTVRFVATLLDAGWRDRTRLVVRKLLPSADYVRASSRLARRGRGGLLLAYLVRPFLVPLKAPAALRALHRSRRQTPDRPGG